jgi:hypothetical protein
MKDSVVTARNEIIRRLRERTSSGKDNIAEGKAGKCHAGNIGRDEGNLAVRADPGSRPGAIIYLPNQESHTTMGVGVLTMTHLQDVFAFPMTIQQGGC